MHELNKGTWCVCFGSGRAKSSIYQHVTGCYVSSAHRDHKETRGSKERMETRDIQGPRGKMDSQERLVLLDPRDHLERLETMELL